MKAIRDSRLRRWMFIVVGLVTLSLAGLADLGFADTSGDQFRKRYELPKDPTTVLADILARDEFTNQQESWISQMRRLMWEAIIRAIKWIIDRLPRFPNFEISDDVGQMILDAQLIGTIALVAGLVGWVAVRLIRARRNQFRAVYAPEEHESADSLGSAKAYVMAMKLAEQRDYRGALIYLFRYVLTWLDEKGTLTVGPGKSNREVLNSVPPGAPIRAPLAEMIPLFNRVRYGDADCRRVDFERFQSLCHTITERM